MNRDSEAFGMLTGIGSVTSEVIRPYVDRIVVLEKMRTDLAELCAQVATEGIYVNEQPVVHLDRVLAIINREDTP